MGMSILFCMLVLGDRPIFQRQTIVSLEPPATVVAIHTPLGTWPNLFAESPLEDRILLDAPTVYMFFGSVTGRPREYHESGIIFTTGPPELENGLPQGWHSFELASLLTDEVTSSDRFALISPAKLTSGPLDHPTVVIFDPRDPDADQQAIKKAEELHQFGIQEIIILKRGDAGLYRKGPSSVDTMSDPNMRRWIAEAELSVFGRIDNSADSLPAAELSISPPMP